MLASVVTDAAAHASHGRPVTLAGCSGGATLALAAVLALRPAAGVAAAVLHEPLVGPAAPTLHAAITANAARLAPPPRSGGEPASFAARVPHRNGGDVPHARSGSEPASFAARVPHRNGGGGGADVGVADFLEGMVGPDSWRALSPEVRRDVLVHAPVVRAEVPGFVAFAPTDLEAATPTTRIVTTVGRTSGPARQEVAEVLAAAGAEVVPIDDAGHLVQLEQPKAWADVVAGVALGDSSEGLPS